MLVSVYRISVPILVLLAMVCRSFGQETKANDFLMLLEKANQLSATKQWNEAAIAWEKVVTLNPVNGEYYASWGDACYNSLQYRKAIDAYKKQLELGYGRLPYIAYNIACCYALSREPEPAIQWLEKAFNTGFLSYEHARNDSDLVILRSDPRFASITAMMDVTKMNRTAGWQHDLEMLRREVMRKSYKGPQFHPDEILGGIKELNTRVAKLNDTEIVIELMRLMVKVNDGHSGVLPPIHMEDFKYSIPLQLYFFKEGLFVIAADPKYKNLLGAEVLNFGGSNIEKVMKVIEPLIPRDNNMGIPQRVPYMMRYTGAMKTLQLIPNKRSVALQVRDINGVVRTVTVEADTTQPNIWNVKPNPSTWTNLPETLSEPVPLYLKRMNKKYWFEYLSNDQTVYCQINSITNDREEPLDKFTERLFSFIDKNEVQKLVIDLRWNNGGNTYLIQPLLKALIGNQKVNKQGKLFIIIGRRTYSAAQNAATSIERYTNAIFVGEPTGSSPNFVGEEDFLILPYSKVMVNVSDLFWQSSWPTDKRTWIAPLIYTPPSFEYYRKNKDEAMEAIRSFKVKKSL